MCASCGCGVGDHGHEQGHGHAYGHGHGHGHEHGEARIVRVEREILDENERGAERNRGWLAARGVVAVNLMGGPGAGKTALLERTIALLDKGSVAVIEGDQETRRDADRVARAGARVAQINTGAGCHLDARMVARALDELRPAVGSLLVIENVGNLVCPALFALGERARAVVLSVAEGDDKPLKYPHMFRAADVLVLNKIDLLPHVEFDLGRAIDAARRVNPRLRVFPLSARTGDGLGDWCGFLRDLLAGPSGA